VHPGVFYQGIDNRVALTGFVRSKEKPVALSDGGGPYKIFDLIIVYLNLTVVEEAFHVGPLVERVADGLAHRALRQVTRLKGVKPQPVRRKTIRLSAQRMAWRKAGPARLSRSCLSHL
jgi:hypothetical protein